MDFQYKAQPQFQDGLLDEVKDRLERLLGFPSAHAKQVRAILCLNILNLHRFAAEWTETNLFPLFDWEDEQRTIAAWVSYSHRGRWYVEFMVAFKPYVISAGHHYDKLPDRQKLFFSNLMTHIALFPSDIFKPAELKDCLSKIHERGIEQILIQLARLLEENDSPTLWADKIEPFIKSTLTLGKLRQVTNRQNISKRLLGIIANAGKGFPDSVTMFKDMLVADIYIPEALFYNCGIGHDEELSLDYAVAFPESVVQLLQSCISSENSYRILERTKERLEQLLEKLHQNINDDQTLANNINELKRRLQSDD